MFVCQSCGFVSKKWLGKCPNCSSWNSFAEEEISQNLKNLKHSEIPEPKTISEIHINTILRKSTEIKEFDRVLGGGLVDGEVLLIGGSPGIGKSTLLSQILNNVSTDKEKGFYLSCEESLAQVKIRFSRLNIENENIYLLSENNLNNALYSIKKINPKFLIIDSIQSVYSEKISSIPGSVSQIRECSSMLIDFAKRNNTILFIIGHITKEGSIAGPKILEHMVDTVLYFESEKNNIYRIVRALKNRFGPVNEIAVFEMTSMGLKEVSNPSEIFINRNIEKNIGSTIFPAIEGTRSILVEIQALVSDSNFSIPKRATQGIDLNRLNILIAILEKNLGINFFNKDIFINVPGGLKINDPAVDLPVALTILSSYLDKEIDKKLTCFGEIGLTGEVRTTSFFEERIRESIRLGYNKILTAGKEKKLENAKIFSISVVNDLINFVE